jgi:hypothetical protein
MKKVLTIEHLAAYLPYELRVQLTDSDYLSKHSKWDGSLIMSGENINLFINTQAKPVLRPLSDLTREITHNGEKFVPLVRLADMFGNGFDSEDIGNETEKYPYEIVKQLHSWHFDTFGLIEAGLAVDINTIKK